MADGARLHNGISFFRGRGAAVCRPPPTPQAPGEAAPALAGCVSIADIEHPPWQAEADGKHFFILTNHYPPLDFFVRT